MDLNQVTIPALSMEDSVKFYVQLGLILIVQSAGYARFACPNGASTVSLELVESLAQPSPTMIYFELLDLDERVAVLQAAGLQFSQLPTDQPWLWREAYLSDPAGNPVCLYWAGTNRLNPPWKIS